MVVQLALEIALLCMYYTGEANGADGEAGMERHTHKPFKEAIAELLREQQGNPLRVNLFAFARTVEGWSYNTLHKMIEGERTLTKAAIEAMAEALDVSPDYFVEYRMMWIMLQMVEQPDIIDHVFDAAKIAVRLRQLASDAEALEQRQLGIEDDQQEGGAVEW